MMKLKRNSMIIIGLVTTLLAIAVVSYVYHLHRERVLLEEELRVEREAELEIIHAYLRLHYAFARVVHPDTLNIDEDGYELIGVDEDIYEVIGARRTRNIYRAHGQYSGMRPNSINDYGVNAIVYLLTRFYYHREGVYLSYKLVDDYFSEEFEPDGSLRLYNNGNHLEIEAFVTWMWEGGSKGEEFDEYVGRISEMLFQYLSEHRDQGFQSRSVDWISPQMLDALARAEADPDYVLDLTSLQEAGY